MGKSTFDLIYDVVKQIPKGNVATYGQVASLAGNRVNLEKYQWNCIGNPDYENWV